MSTLLLQKLGANVNQTWQKASMGDVQMKDHTYFQGDVITNSENTLTTLEKIFSRATKSISMKLPTKQIILVSANKGTCPSAGI